MQYDENRIMLKLCYVVLYGASLWGFVRLIANHSDKLLLVNPHH